jgi:hypothetical protein
MVKILRMALLLVFIGWGSVPERADGSFASTNFPIALRAEGITNFFKLSDRIYSGAAPEGDAAFLALQKLGVKTLLSVDGSKPNVEMAHKYGMQYVHLPHGYNGISPRVQAELIKAEQTLPCPIFVHCHHGQHRGPAAAAVICMGNEGWDIAKARAWLKTAGTAANYVGLFKTVDDFRAPSVEELKELPSNFPEVATLPGLVEAMVGIDEQWDHLKDIRNAAYQAPKKHPDYDPPNEAVILWEHFREAQRLKEAKDRGNGFLEKLKIAEKRGHEIENLLRTTEADELGEGRSRLDNAMNAMNQNCLACHKSYRDPAR